MNREQVRTLVRGAYDVQKLRIQTGNRVVANWKVKIGQEPGKSETDELDAEGQRILKKLRRDYKRIADAIGDNPTLKQLDKHAEGIISDFTEFALVAQYETMIDGEEAHFKRLKRIVEAHPLWPAFLKGIRGIGPAMAGVLLSEFDIHKARYPSSLWKYAGLDVCKDGRGKSRRKDQMVEQTYTDSEGNEQTKMGLGYNPWLKTKLMGVLSTCFLRSGGKYKDVYDGYKHRLECAEAHKEKSKGHRHSMAMRYCVKMFLADLYVAWRTLEGLPVSLPYSEEKLGNKPHRGVA